MIPSLRKDPRSHGEDVLIGEHFHFFLHPCSGPGGWPSPQRLRCWQRRR